MKKQYDISFIIPVYNVQKYIGKCLDSILNQSGVSKEIIVVDDGSTDNSLEILKHYNDRYEDVVLICQKNLGASVARNKGIDIAKGKWISFIDSDDYVEHNCIGDIMKNVSEEVDIIYTDYANYTQNKVVKHGYSENAMTFVEKDFELFQRATLNKNYIPKDLQIITPWAKLYRTEFLNKNNIRYTPGVRKSQDLLFNFEVYHYAKSGLYVPVLMYYYRYNRESLCNKYLSDVLVDYMKQQEKIRKLLINYDKYVIMEDDYNFRCAVNYMFSVRLDYAHVDNPKKYIVKKDDFINSLKIDEVWHSLCNVNENQFSFKEKILLQAVKRKQFWFISFLNWGYSIIENYNR